jgi:hypothetical protein
MVEFIKDGDDIAAIIIRNSLSYKEGVEFLTPSNFAIQAGLNNRLKNTKVKAHAHFKIKELNDIKPAEVFYIKKGKISINLYGADNKKFKNVILGQGDFIYMLCGHSLEFLEDTQLIEVKQGPYKTKEEDKYFI